MNPHTSFRKAFRDLWENKARALLVLLALLVGVIGVSTVAATYSILPREMDKNYLRTDPASATLWLDAADPDLARAAAALPRLAAAEARSEIVGRFQTAPGEWRVLLLYVVPDFKSMRLDRFTSEQGAWPPETGEILLERTALGVASAELGDRVKVKLPNRPARELSFTGTVHMPGMPPAWVEGSVYGYITPETLALFGDGAKLDQLKILAAENRFDEAAIRRTAYEVKAWLESRGRVVTRVDVPVPGRHVHADLMAAFIAMLGAMGLLVLVMSGVLVTNMIAALVSRQVRQIGVMKAVGGAAGQIAGIYAALVLALGLASIAVGLPLGLVLGRALAGFQAERMLNFEIFDYTVDAWVFALVAAVGLAVPLLAAAVPVRKGSRVTVLAALSDAGAGKGTFGAGRLDAWLGRLRGGARSVLLALRNAFRRRGRLVLTLVTLAAAGANFITALNTGASVDRAVEQKYEATPYDIEFAFSRAYPGPDLERIAGRIDGVESAETWGGARSSVVLPDNTLGKKLRLTAPRLGAELAPRPAVIAGRWLSPDDRDAIVMSDALMKETKINAPLGGEIRLDINGRTTVWRLVGVTREFLAVTAWVSPEALVRAAGPESAAATLVVRAGDPARIARIARDLDAGLAGEGFDVYTMWKTSDARRVVEDHMVLLTGILFVMAALFVIVGGLGLASTMSLNVLDRTRELGVMRAVGATTGTILRVVVLEGAIIGALSWFLSLLLSVPYSALMGEVIAVFLESPLDLAVSPPGWLMWLLAAVVIGTVASAFPAWNAARRSVHAVLAYE